MAHNAIAVIVCHPTRLFDVCQTIAPLARGGLFEQDKTVAMSDSKSRKNGRAAARKTADGMTVLQALADPVRLDIVRQLARCGGDGEMSCGSIEVSVSKSTASHHIRTLASAGIIGEREDGRTKYLWLRSGDLEARFPGLIEAVLHATRPTR